MSFPFVSGSSFTVRVTRRCLKSTVLKPLSPGLSFLGVSSGSLDPQTESRNQLRIRQAPHPVHGPPEFLLSATLPPPLPRLSLCLRSPECHDLCYLKVGSFPLSGTVRGPREWTLGCFRFRILFTTMGSFSECYLVRLGLILCVCFWELSYFLDDH